MNPFKGKRVVITGASRGVGFEASKLFLAQGAEVFGIARDAARLAAAARELSGLGTFSAFVADLDDPAAPAAAAAELAKRWPAVDILVNNAAIQTWSGDWSRERPQQLERELRVNVVAPHAMILALLPLLRLSADPRIINVSSGAGIRQSLMDSGEGATYKLSKYAVNGLTLLWAGQLKGEVAVNSLDPGWLKTDLGGPNAPGEPIDGGRRMLALAGMPSGVTGKFYHGDEELPF
jgi:NAD(P)-dependent dehydrogenase (short-subunit alcohol dehydrogenase family)